MDKKKIINVQITEEADDLLRKEAYDQRKTKTQLASEAIIKKYGNPPCPH